MARPKTIKLEGGGEVILKNCSPEVYVKIKAALNPPVQIESSEPEEEEVKEIKVISPAASIPVSVSTALESNAIGTFKKDKVGYGIAYIKFNPDTKEAKVDSIEMIGKDRGQTEESFKIGVIKKGILGS